MNEAALRKIKRCLALAASDNANEAATALRQAQKLMEVHGLSMSDVKISDVSEQRTKMSAAKTPAFHLLLLTNVMEGVFGVKTIHSHRRSRGKWQSDVIFIGLGSQAELAVYCFEVLKRQLDQARKGFIEKIAHANRSQRIRLADIYCVGWVHEVQTKVADFAVPPEQDALMETYIERKHDVGDEKMSSRKLKPVDGAGRAFAMGQEDASDVVLHRGVGAEETNQLEVIK